MEKKDLIDPEKKALIQALKEALRKEFFDIDHVIDEVVDAVAGWYLLPDLNTGIMTINLWGMTGVAKTSLAIFILKFLNLETRSIHVDMGSTKKNDMDLLNQLEHLFEGGRIHRPVILLDEFQRARTLDELGNEIDEDATRCVWELLDTGIVKRQNPVRTIDDFSSMVRTLDRLVKAGVRAENGYVTEGRELFIKYIHYNTLEDDTMPLRFVGDAYEYNLQQLYPEDFNNAMDVEDTLLNMNEQESLAFLKESASLMRLPRKIDCSGALVFVMGNLDELYPMAKDFNADIDADTFRAHSLRITYTEVKEALKKRFRAEQIARLGNQHILYPALGKKGFQSIITKELKAYGSQLEQKFGLHLAVDDSLKTYLYSEGVVLTQGARPLKSTIKNVVQPLLQHILLHLTKHELEANTIAITVVEHSANYQLSKHGKKLFSGEYELPAKMKKLRSNRGGDLQASTAVHEAGHAVALAFLLNEIPEQVYSVTADAGSRGFVYTRNKDVVQTQERILDEVQVLLAGKAAEEIAFRSMGVSDGCTEDITKATRLYADFLRNGGYDALRYDFPNALRNGYVVEEQNEISARVKEDLDELYLRVKALLNEQMTLFLQMARTLTFTPMLTKSEIQELIHTYGVNLDRYQYREKKQGQLSRLHRVCEAYNIDNSHPQECEPIIAES